MPWATPNSGGGGKQRSLYNDMKEWKKGKKQMWPTRNSSEYPTPSMRDYKGTNSMEHLTRDIGKDNHTNQLPKFIKLKDGKQKTGSLNPDWVEWLMAFPIGWTDIDCDEPESEIRSQNYDPGDYDLPRLTTVSKNRANRIKALGNAVVPLQAYVIGSWIKTHIENKDNNEQ